MQGKSKRPHLLPPLSIFIKRAKLTDMELAMLKKTHHAARLKLWMIATVLKTVEHREVLRGFESHSLRQVSLAQVILRGHRPLNKYVVDTCTPAGYNRGTVSNRRHNGRKSSVPAR